MPEKAWKDLAPSLEVIVREFKSAGLNLSRPEAEKFLALNELLARRNPGGDLTRLRSFGDILYRHYIDGALAAELISPRGLTMDLGSGAGFPGLPLAIRRPDWPLLLAEPRGRRLAFMEEAALLLGLGNVDFYPHKVGPRFDRAIDNFITRDFESAPDSLRRAALIIPPGGRVYLMKGAGVDPELKEARSLPEWNDFELEDDRAYELGGGLKRRLITWRKKEHGRRPAPPPPFRLTEIASRENPRYKSWLRALSGRGLKKGGLALISGRKFIGEILKAQPGRSAGLLVRRLDELGALSLPDGLPVFLLRPELWPPLDLFGAGPPLMLLSIPEPPLWDGRLAGGLTVFLPFQDPANLGTAIRSAAALGVPVVLLKEAASPWHPKSLRASGPAVLAADLRRGPSLGELAALDQPGLLALSPTGTDLLRKEFPARCGLVFGLEGPGLDRSWPPDRRLAIPMVPGVESLNAAAALALALGVWLARPGRPPR